MRLVTPPALVWSGAAPGEGDISPMSSRIREVMSLHAQSSTPGSALTVSSVPRQHSPDGIELVYRIGRAGGIRIGRRLRGTQLSSGPPGPGRGRPPAGGRR